MKNYKNYLIAVLTGLLVLSLFTQPAQSAPVKTYDAVKVAEYSACLIGLTTDWGVTGNDYDGINVALAACKKLRPK
jgi:hypothetical protein